MKLHLHSLQFCNFAATRLPTNTILIVFFHNVGVLKGNLNVPQEWIDLKPDTNCVKKMHDQIKLEVKASLQYLAMGAYFSQDTINRGGFADFFFKAAGEEREHAYKLIEYLLMRGLFFGDGKDTLKGLIKVEVNPLLWFKPSELPSLS